MGGEEGTSGVTVLALHGGWILIEAQRIKLLKIRLSLLVLFLILHHLPHRSPSLPPSLSPSPRSLLSGWPRLRTIFFSFPFFFFPSPPPHPRFFISRIFIDSCNSNVRYPPLRRGRANSKPRLELEEGGGISVSVSHRSNFDHKNRYRSGPFFFPPLPLVSSFANALTFRIVANCVSSVVARESKSKQ